MVISILGTPYTVYRQTDKENPKLGDADGICEIYSKKICLREIEENASTFDNLDEYRNKVLRHEIIHGFFAESGLRGNTDYANNEELVDWIAIQFPKIAKVFSELGILEEVKNNDV